MVFPCASRDVAGERFHRDRDRPLFGRSYEERTLWGVEVLPRVQTASSIDVRHQLPAEAPLPLAAARSQPAAAVTVTAGGPAAQPSAGAVPANLPPSAPPLRFDVTVTRGRDMLVPPEVANAVLASLPDGQGRRDPPVQLSLVLWLGQPMSHQWAATLRRGGAILTTAASPWVVPAAEWSDDVLRTPRGHCLFPHGTGRLSVTVWCGVTRLQSCMGSPVDGQPSLRVHL